MQIALYGHLWLQQIDLFDNAYVQTSKTPRKKSWGSNTYNHKLQEGILRTFALIFTALFFSACGQNQEKASQQQADFNQHCLEFAEAEPTLFNMEISKSCDCMWTQMSETMTTAQREYLISFQTAMIKDYDKAIKMSKDGIWDEFKPLYQNMGDACNLG